MITEIKITWCIEDVFSRAEELEITCSPEEASNILEKMERYHDANYGICWETIDCYLRDLVRERKEDNV